MRAAVVAICTAFICGLLVGTSTAGGGVNIGSNAESVAPGWARSVHVAVRDDSGNPVHYSVMFSWDNRRFGGGYDACSDRPLHARVPHAEARVSITIHAAIEPCVAVPSRGTITVTYIGRGRRSSETTRYTGPNGVSLP